MNYDQPPKCMEICDVKHGARCPATADQVHVCVEEGGHQTSHHCACGASWNLEGN